DRPTGRLGDGVDVVAVDGLAGHPVAGRLLGERLDAEGAGGGHGHAVLVVLAHEHDRQLPHRGEGEGLVPGPLPDGAVAVEADGDAAVAGEPVGQPGAGGDRDAARDDAVGAEVPGGDVG